MDMLMGEQIAAAGLTDWRKLAQGLHARYLVADFGSAARFVAAVGDAGDELGHHPGVSIGDGFVDLRLVTDDAVYREDDGTEHVIEWVTQQDVELARRITGIAAAHGLDADPTSVSMIELGLGTSRSATIAPVWAALLTGNAEAQGRGTPSDEIRDATGRVPNLWFGDADDNGQLRSPIYGPTLDGSLAGNQVIGDTDGGVFDGLGAAPPTTGVDGLRLEKPADRLGHGINSATERVVGNHRRREPA